MKKYLLGLLAIVFATCLFAFTMQRKSSWGIVYIYYRNGEERNFNNWQTSSPVSSPPDACTYSFNPIPCWLRVDAGFDFTIQPWEFYAAFDVIDGGLGAGDGFISDELPDDMHFSLQDY